ncbi:MAG: 30S ribosomal protein S6 [Planctomycetes bacterium]|nr:30S ribosomal protein S6 [Planctomycetota bacterium]
MSRSMDSARDYEVMLLVSPPAGKETWDDVRKRLGETFQHHEAEIVKDAKWADRRLAYPIGKHRKGIYHLMHVRAAPARIAPLRRDLQLQESVLRELILARSGAPTFSEAPRDDAVSDYEADAG